MNTNGELERLVEECDPIASHAKIMSYLKPSMPHIVHKEHFSKQLPFRTVADNGDEQLPMSSDEQIDALAAVIVEMKNDLRAEFQDVVENAIGPLAEAVAMLQSQTATLQGQVSVLMNMISGIVSNNGNGNGNSSKSIEASEVRTTRRVRVRRTSDGAS